MDIDVDPAVDSFQQKDYWGEPGDEIPLEYQFNLKRLKSDDLVNFKRAWFDSRSDEMTRRKLVGALDQLRQETMSQTSAILTGALPTAALGGLGFLINPSVALAGAFAGGAIALYTAWKWQRMDEPARVRFMNQVAAISSPPAVQPSAAAPPCPESGPDVDDLRNSSSAGTGL
jgi:hypothetical protein